MKQLLIMPLLLLSQLVYGQFDEPKFGKIDEADLSMKAYDRDTTAEALYLFDNGVSRFVLSPDLSFQILFERHCQIKIFKESAFPVSEFTIRLYKSGGKRESMSELKAFTYNLNGGKVVKTKLERDNIFYSDADNYTEVKFAFPEVRVGSVLELTYSITSDFVYNFRGWTFQKSFPLRWSQYRYEIPEYYKYRQSSKGYMKFDVDKKEQGINNYSYKVSGDDENRFGYKAASSVQSLKVITSKGILAIKDVPGFKEEPNVDCSDNYLQSIEFELSSIHFPNSNPVDYTQSWESVNKQMIEDEDFGLLLKPASFVKDTVAAICSNSKTELEKANAIYSWAVKRVKWDDSYHIWAMKGLKKPFTDRVGNSAELNLLLTMMLRSAGLNANPVLFSTRENGIALTYFPTITKYNSVLSAVSIDGKVYLLDAAGRNCPFGILPVNDINGNGRVVNETGGDWVKLDPLRKYEVSTTYKMNIDEEGRLTGKIAESHDGYAGVILRNRISSEKSESDFFKKLEERVKGLTINSFSVSMAKDINKPLVDTLDVEIADKAQSVGDKIMLNPLLFETIEKNPYTLEERKYPVDYNFPITEHYVFKYTLPEKFVAESLPKPATIKTPDGSILATYDIREEGRVITVVYSFEVNKMIFLPQDYKNIKSLYDQLVKKHAEQIIIKKI